ncbi:MAG: recombination mediator RecR [Ruminococcus sp.]|nr:recombination protein RecR [Ruminococcus sp.]MDO4420072.1 recombination mediator RecR [Ruminococcus sp.]
MDAYNVVPLTKLVEQFESLPGIGSKTAQRLAYHVLGLSKAEAEEFATAITEAHEKIKYCKTCCNFSDSDQCPVCSSLNRDHSVICVVETPRDAIAIENTREYKGTYHVLHGAISPLNGVGPNELYIKELLARVNNEEVSEVIIATNSTVEGEATGMYLSKLLKALGIKVTRLAFGIPVGSDLEYADGVTLTKALEGRSEM